VFSLRKIARHLQANLGNSSHSLLSSMSRKMLTLKRRAPRDCQHEPPYPGLHTVLISMRDPDMTAHSPSKRCPIEEPHQIAKCGEFQPKPKR
jgi:hypothetical protein